MLNIRRAATPLLLSLLAVALLAAPAQAAKPWVKLDNPYIYEGSNTKLTVGIKHGGGPVRNLKVCWESTSWCVSGGGIGGGRWGATFSSPTKLMAWRKMVVYYTIDGYSFKHVIRLKAGEGSGGAAISP